MIERRLWTCGRCRTDNLARSASCRRCGAPRSSAVAGGSPGFAAILSGLLPGLGQVYQDRVLRGVLMLLVPAFALTLAGAFIFIADPLTRFAVRNASLVALVVVGGIFAVHIVSVADAFAGRLGELRGRHVIDYLVLAAVTVALIFFYGAVYRGGSAWADLAAKVFEPVARALPATVEESPPPQWSGSDRLNVLLLGIDRRGRVSETQNTDTVILLSLDPLNRTAAMLSIPRDTLVTIPGHGQDKVNSAYSKVGAERGPDLVRRTVEDFLGIPVHSYALIDFDAFTRTVDAFGGVLVDVKRPLRDEEYPTADFGIERLHLLV
ncbi:MAG TPA: LCP family protein, partial [Candidatus Limnocylindria bacterium]|nr:LCP family protein [Candidatus Limnocylindria bacterium]